MYNKHAKIRSSTNQRIDVLINQSIHKKSISIYFNRPLNQNIRFFDVAMAQAKIMLFNCFYQRGSC